MKFNRKSVIIIDQNHSRTLAARPRAGCFPVLFLLAGLLTANAKADVIFTSLHSFQASTNGVNPQAGLVQGSDGYFYGTTSGGGTNGYGTVFKIATNGTLTTLYAFTGTNDGAFPIAGLVQGSDGNFYGTTSDGGTNHVGTVFKITTNGALTSLHSFTGGDDGSQPYAGLVQGSDGKFYGTTYSGGTSNLGTVFKITTNGALTSLYSFTGTNGANPSARLVQGGDGYFYGTTFYGGTNSDGTVFKITTNGALTSLYSFTFTGGNDGLYPYAGLVRGSDGYFYGTTYLGGTNHGGAVFKITTNGALTTLYSFTGGNDGGYIYAGLVQGSDGNFYGTTWTGGTNNAGTVFQITTNGALTNLYSFTDTNDGSQPYAGLVQGTDGKFYGTTYNGGTNDGQGTVFQITTNGALIPLYSFGGGTDGASPRAGLVQGSDGNFYGTTIIGGTNYLGTVFQITANGALTTLYSFTGTNGANPQAGLVQGNDGSFYGTTAGGGTNNAGTVFQITTNGSLTPLHSFTGADGQFPRTGLAQGRDGNFYGTTFYGGTHGIGTVFRIYPGGSLTNLYSFTGFIDGDNPYAGLVQGSDGNLYGTASNGSTNNAGTVFKITTNGALTHLHSFGPLTGFDGAHPLGGLVQGSDGKLYGTTEVGGNNNNGTVFKISTNGALTPLHYFVGGTDGATPWAGLVQGSDGNFYGTTAGLSPPDFGTVFKISTSGTLTTLYAFTGGNDGAYPKAGLVQGSDGSFYGTTSAGGQGGVGTVFRLTIVPPTLAIIRSGTNVILKWPTNYAGFTTDFTLEFATNLASPTVWQTNSTAPVVIGGQNVVTNPITGTQRFFRLQQ